MVGWARGVEKIKCKKGVVDTNRGGIMNEE